MDDLLARTVRNNADWCSRICALHGSPGQFGYAAWVCDHPAPLYYPNIVTLRPDCVTAQTALVQSLRDQADPCGVKDSFRTLNLAHLGFRPAIRGRWLRYLGLPETSVRLEWRPIQTVAELAAWEIAWGGEAHRSHRRLFQPALLSDETVTFLAGFWAGSLVAGGILSRDADVIGLSNVFGPTGPERRAVINQATRLAGPTPLVGWEAEDEAVSGETLGGLQVWLREGPRTARRYSTSGGGPS